MDINKIMTRVKAILLTPRTEWPVIAAETANNKSIYMDYVLPLAALPAIATFLKLSIIGTGVPFLGNFRLPMSTGISSAVLGYVLSLLSVFILSLIINALAQTFGGTKDSTQALKTAAYSHTAAWIGGIGAMVPGLGWLLPIPFYFMEILVGLVQALVFMLLTAVFTLLICEHDESHSHAEGAKH